MNAIEVSSVRKYFGRTRALHDISLQLPQGKFLAIAGRNGSGKSTLLAVIAGMLRPDSGSVSLLGHSVYEEKRSAMIRKRCALQGYQGQRLQMYAELTVRENLRLSATAWGVANLDASLDRVIENLSLNQSQHKRLKECSQGISKRVSLARALVHEPKVLLLDEPFANLDQESQQGLCEVLAKVLRQGVSILAALHEMEAVKDHIDQVLVLEEGRLQP